MPELDVFPTHNLVEDELGGRRPGSQDVAGDWRIQIEVRELGAVHRHNCAALISPDSVMWVPRSPLHRYCMSLFKPRGHHDCSFFSGTGAIAAE